VFQGWYATFGNIAPRISVTLYLGDYFRDPRTGNKTNQFWAGIEAFGGMERALRTLLQSEPGEDYRVVDDGDYEGNDEWLPTSRRSEWYEPHLDVADRHEYVWFGRFFDAKWADDRLVTEISEFLPTVPHVAEFFVRKELDRSNLSPTEKEVLGKVRLAQSKFRSDLMRQWDGRCSVTGCPVAEVLRASHIKPWARCPTERERRDIDNGLLLSANLDALFENGLISFRDTGLILISTQLSRAERIRLKVNASLKLREPPSPGQKKYLEWHRSRKFAK
jgi:hypothetical protein